MADITTIIMLICIIGVAASVQSSAGFGFSIICMIFLPQLLAVVDSMVIISVVNFVAVTAVTIRYRKHIQWKQLGLPLILSLLGNYIGLREITTMDNGTAMVVIGTSLIVLSMYLLFFSSRIHLQPNYINSGICGSVSGLMSGFFSIPGPPMVLYYSTATKTKEAYIATIQFFFLVNGIFKVTFFMTSVEFDQGTWKVIPLLLLAAGAGTLAGSWLFDRISEKVMKRMVYVFMTAAGLYYVLL